MQSNDYEAVRRLIARQAQLRDDDLVDEWTANWSDDALFEAAGHTFEGRDAICAALVGDFEPGAGWHSLHLLSEPVIDLDGDRATAVTDLVQVVPGPDQELVIGGVYRYLDELRRDAAGWRLCRRAVEIRHRIPRR